jgi:hypothetical protein
MLGGAIFLLLAVMTLAAVFAPPILPCFGPIMGRGLDANGQPRYFLTCHEYVEGGGTIVLTRWVTLPYTNPIEATRQAAKEHLTSLCNQWRAAFTQPNGVAIQAQFAIGAPPEVSASATVVAHVAAQEDLLVLAEWSGRNSSSRFYMVALDDGKCGWLSAEVVEVSEAIPTIVP